MIAVLQEPTFTRDLHDVRSEMLKNFSKYKEGMDRPLTTLTVHFIVLIQWPETWMCILKFYILSKWIPDIKGFQRAVGAALYREAFQSEFPRCH